MPLCNCRPLIGQETFPEAKEVSEHYSWGTIFPVIPRVYAPAESHTVRRDKL